MQETLHDHHTLISMDEGPYATYDLLTTLILGDGSNGELQEPTNRLIDRAMAYGMEISTEKSKIMTNSKNNISADISMNGQKLEDVTSFKYLGATLCKAAPAQQKSISGFPQQWQQWPE